MRHNFWINENRQETVPNLSKNDNYSQAVLTDCYKQVQNGGHPSQFNSCIPSQNNDARSHPIDQQRSPGSQYMLPYSVCSLPLKSSYVSSFHTQQAFSIQSNDSCFSSQYSQAQQNLSDSSGLMNFKNPNTSVCQVYSSSISALTRDNQNTNSQVPRIRVRDVFSLNKNTISSEVPNNSSYLTHQNEQHKYAPNFSCNAICSNENQSQFVSYGRNNLQQSNYSVPYYHPTEREHFQNSNSFYHQNTEGQQFGASQHLERNLNLDVSEMNTKVKCSLFEKALKQANSQNPNVQNKNSSQLALTSRRVRIVPKRNSVEINGSSGINNSGYGCTPDVNNRLAHESSNLVNFTQLQNERPIRDETCSLRSNSTIQRSNDGPQGTTAAGAKSPSNQQSNSQDGTVIKISIPHNGQSTYVTLSDCGSTNKNSNLNLPYLLEEDDHLFVGWGQNNRPCKNANDNCVNVQVAEIGEERLKKHCTPSSVNNAINGSPNPAQNSHISESSYPQNLNAPPRKRFCQIREPFLDLNKENLRQFLGSGFENNLENSNSGVGSNESIARETIFQNEITPRLKQEKLNGRVESPVHDVSEGLPNKGVLFEIIKTEKNAIDENPAEQEDETQSSEEPNTLHQPLTSETEINENTEYTRIEDKDFVLSPEILEPASQAVKDSENCVQQAVNSKNDSNCQRHGSLAGNRQTIVAAEENYKSKINRDKLDMLIQFLEKDEDPVQTNLQPTVKKQSGDKKHRSRKVDLNHNRRKLNKTCIIKNKNNSREMISMISNKNSRLEFPKCSPPTPQIEKQNSDTAKEKIVSSNDEKSSSGESRDSSEKSVKCNPREEGQAEGDEGLSLFASKSATKQFQETSDEGLPSDSLIQKGENVMNKIRTIQYAETVFCKNCDLVATLDSFWINLASGELKCLNCFKKILLKSEEITSKSKTNYVSNSGVRPSEKGGTGKESERTREIERNVDSSFKEKHRTKGFSKLVRSDTNLKNKEIVQHEIEKSPDRVGSEKNYISGNPKKETIPSPKSSRRPSFSENKPAEKGRSSEEQKRIRKEIPEEQPMKTITSYSWNHKIKHSEDISKTIRKSDVSLENSTYSKPLSISKQLTGALEKSEREDDSTNSKVKVSVENLKKDQVSDQLLKRNNAKDYVTSRTLRKSLSRDEENADECTKKEKNLRRSQSKEFVSHKSPEVCLKTDAKRSAEKSVKKTRESHTIHNDNPEPTTKKSTKHEESERTSKESCHNLKGSNSSEELSTKGTTCISNSEKHKRTECIGQARKRKNSDEDIGAIKVRIVEDVVKKEVKLGPLSIPTTSKESITKYIRKPLENEMQNLKNSDKFRRNSLLKDEAEHSKKDAKQVLYSSSNGKVKEEKKVGTTFETAKPQENTKQKASDRVDTSRRKSKEEVVVHKQTKNEVKQGTEAAERRKGNSKERSPRSHIEELSKTKHSGEHNGKETEGREKNHSRKTPKTDTSTEKLRTSDTASRLLKESQNTKTRSSAATEDGKLKHKNREEDKRERKKNKKDREDVKKTRNKATTERTIKKDVESSSNKKKCSDRSEGKRDKNQAENSQAKPLDRPVECCLGRKVEGGALAKIQSRTHSGTLFAKLMQKTKKLSWSLLSEA